MLWFFRKAQNEIEILVVAQRQQRQQPPQAKKYVERMLKGFRNKRKDFERNLKGLVVSHTRYSSSSENNGNEIDGCGLLLILGVSALPNKRKRKRCS